mmetsp:Transcript_20020/g.66587  ORF Transcript_20020/g.66587 Transcript_20020/m.66587 type:complete len:207 (-) Transcript_20020:128-748(-)
MDGRKREQRKEEARWRSPLLARSSDRSVSPVLSAMHSLREQEIPEDSSQLASLRVFRDDMPNNKLRSTRDDSLRGGWGRAGNRKMSSPFLRPTRRDPLSDKVTTRSRSQGSVRVETSLQWREGVGLVDVQEYNQLPLDVGKKENKASDKRSFHPRGPMERSRSSVVLPTLSSLLTLWMTTSSSGRSRANHLSCSPSGWRSSSPRSK